MGLMEEFGAWLDQKKKNIVVNAQNLPGLLSSFAQDVQQGAAADKSAFDATKSVMPGVREAGIREMNARGQELGGLLGSIKAFHGSPHKFDKFDLSKIGTGEGAQAYGHGLYLADNPQVANEYANLLKGAGPSKAQFLRLRDAAPVGSKEWKHYDDLAKEGQSNLYEASIRWPDAAREAADPLGPQHFLDWDKPLSEQPKAVRDGLAAMDPDQYAPHGADYDPMEQGQIIYHRLMNQKRDYAIDAGKNAQTTLPASQAAASDDLRAFGIPGIRYLDGGSRGAGQGTHNYVVFDDNLLEILKRNGQPLGLLAP